MRWFAIALCLLALSTEAHSQDRKAAGSICMQAEYVDGHRIRSTICLVWMQHEVPFTIGAYTGAAQVDSTGKADRLVPARPVTAEAAPK